MKYNNNTKKQLRYSCENMTVFASALNFYTMVYIFENMRGAPKILVPFKINFLFKIVFNIF